MNPSPKKAIFTVMKFGEVILLSLSVAFTIMGIHQVITMGLSHAYWAIMLALIFFFIYTLKKRKAG
jgi:predicted membrane protein